MQVHEIYELSTWFTTNIQSKKIDSLLTNCINQLKAKQPSQAPSFVQSKNALIDAVTRINREKLTDNQKRCLDNMGITPFILETSGERLESLFEMYSSDTSYVVSILDEYAKSVKGAAQAFSQVRASMPIILPKSLIQSINVPEGKILTRITFQNDASINNLVEFNDWAKRWGSIARGFSMAINEPPEDFEIINADRGSFIIDLLVGSKAMQILFESLKSLTDLAISVTELRIKLAELEALKNTVPDDLFEKFAKASSESIEKKEDEIIERVISSLKEKGLVKNDTTNNELSRAIKEVHRFNSYGGSLNCLASNDENFNAETVKELNTSYKLLQNKTELRLIEDKKE